MYSPTKDERVGIFGGSFDPPHIAHLALVAEACHQLELARVYWVLTPHGPHKTSQEITPLEHRLEMLRAAIAGNQTYALSTVEIERQPPYYALDTIRIFKRNFPKASLVYLMGGDSLRDLPAWHEPLLFVAACDVIAVMQRPGVQASLLSLEADIPGISRRVQLIEAPLLEISSSDIRQRIRQEKPFRYMLPERVYQIIQDYQLYR